jgi:hypothetical protein
MLEIEWEAGVPPKFDPIVMKGFVGVSGWFCEFSANSKISQSRELRNLIDCEEIRVAD